MQTLVFEIACTFVDDALALVKGAGTIALHAITAPVERVARACDVAGVLSRRKTAQRSHGGRERSFRVCWRLAE